MSAPEELLERIRLRLDESFAGIGEVVAELQPADVADLVNQLQRHEAAAVMSMLAVPRAIEVFDQPTLNRRSAILEEMEPGRAAQILDGLAADERTFILRGMGELARRRLVPKLSPGMRAEVERLATDGVVEVTLLGKTFTQAWEAGAATLATRPFSVIEMKEAWRTYAPLRPRWRTRSRTPCSWSAIRTSRAGTCFPTCPARGTRRSSSSAGTARRADGGRSRSSRTRSASRWFAKRARKCWK